MAHDATTLARNLLAADPGGMEELRVHLFELDGDEHDDEATAKLYADFSTEFDEVVATLSQEYGTPNRTGEGEDIEVEMIPLNGIARFAVWSAGAQQLYVAVAHEDRGAPILMMLGTAG